MSVGKNIRYFRNRKGISQEVLGEKVGLSKSQISQIETGAKSTSVERLSKIADVLGINVSDLYDEEDKIKDEDAWIIFTDELKKEGIKPEQAKKWIDFAKQFIDENK